MGTVSDKPRVTVLICAANEKDNLSHVLPQVPADIYEVLLVDGYSTDGTVDPPKKLRPDIRILYQQGRGKGDALEFGIKHATGDIVVTLDADGATDAREMQKFIAPLLDGYDVAKGSRFLGRFPRNKPWHRILGNWLITITFDVLFFKKYTDMCSG